MGFPGWTKLRLGLPKMSRERAPKELQKPKEHRTQDRVTYVTITVIGCDISLLLGMDMGDVIPIPGGRKRTKMMPKGAEPGSTTPCLGAY
jgi:hypothetical protein